MSYTLAFLCALLPLNASLFFYVYPYEVYSWVSTLHSPKTWEL